MKYFPDLPEINIIVTCEHGGNRLPAPYRALFSDKEKLLSSHRGYDAGALAVARSLAQKLRADCFASNITRLLIDPNRSPGHRNLFSQLSRQLDISQKEQIIKTCYLPYRQKVQRAIDHSISKNVPVLHISVHSFAPVVGRKKRTADLGLLYDPARLLEKVLCRQWQQQIKKDSSALRVRRNYPYQGKTDGLVTSLRKIFEPRLYIGIELEINQTLLRQNKSCGRIICDALVKVIRYDAAYH